jgi:hypothetical protein
MLGRKKGRVRERVCRGRKKEGEVGGIKGGGVGVRG